MSTSRTKATERATQAKKTSKAHATEKIPPGVVAIVATGDIVMGSTPNLPPDGGRSFFSDVQTDLAGDVVLGNLEGTLSTRRELEVRRWRARTASRSRRRRRTRAGSRGAGFTS